MKSSGWAVDDWYKTGVLQVILVILQIVLAEIGIIEKLARPRRRRKK